MSEEWTEVEWRNPGGWMESTVRFRYRSVGNDELYEVVQHIGEGRASLDGFSFAAGMEAARQEIRELIESEAEAFEASRDALLRADNPTRAMDCDGRAHTLRTVLRHLSPPDSETES